VLTIAAAGPGPSIHAGAGQQGAVAQGEGVIAGRVVDALTGEPIAGAQVDLRGFAPVTPTRAGPLTVNVAPDESRTMDLVARP
jgi:hypothetical protein